MAINSVRVVSSLGGDWIGLYINGKIVYQGHSIPTSVWLSIFAPAAQVVSQEEVFMTEVEFPEYYVSIGD